MLDKERIIKLLQWFILLAMFAYDGFTYLPEEMDFALLKSLYYVVIFIAFVLVICLQTSRGRVPYQPIGTVSYAIQVFIWLYLTRLLYDFMIAGVDQEIVTNPFAAIFLYANAAIIPFYGFLFFRWDLIDLRKLNTAILLILLIMGMVSMYNIFTGKALEYLGPDGRFMGNASMDTIAFGHLGTSLFLLGLSLFYQQDIRLWHKLLSIVSLVSGLFISIAAGSRGAMVALIFCFLAYLYMNGHKRKVLIGIPVLVALLVALLPVLNDFLINTMDNHALERLYASIYDPNSMDAGVTSGRDLLYEKAWQNFSDSPIIGTSFFIDGKYVHNSIFESFIGLGLVGGCLFTYFILYAFISAFQIVQRNKCYMFFALLSIQYIVYSLFSRTLSLFPIFWLTLYLVIFIKNNEFYSPDNKS